MVRMGSVAFLPVVLASESVLMQSQATSEGALALDSANVHMMEALHSGSSRVQKMQQNTQAMEEQYKSILEKIVASQSLTDPKTGDPFVPAPQFLKMVEEQFTALETELKDEKRDNEKILSDAHDSVVLCNTVRQTEFDKDGGVEALVATMKAARGAHNECRVEEDSAITTMESECKSFQDLGSKCDVNQDWYAQYNDGSIVVSADNTLQSVVDSAVKCKDGVDALTQRATTCDGKQKEFKGSYCKYEASLQGVCKRHADCYKLETKNLAGSRESVEALEKEQKTIWRMVGKVDCYLKVLIAAAPGSMPTEGDITHCSTTDIADDELTITYKPPVAEDACLQNPDLEGEHALPGYRPGYGTWYKDEMKDRFGDLTLHSKLTPDSKC